MKKQFSYLMMVLAVMILAGTSAMAQGDTPANPVWHLAGATENLAVDNNGAGFSYSWAVANAVCITGADDGNDGTASFTTDDAATGVLEYTSAAAGLYRISCTESNGNCTTTRVFFTAIADVNATVIASDNLGAPLGVGADATCNDYDSGVTPADLVDNTIDPLNAYTGGGSSTRYFNVTLVVGDGSGCTIAGAPAASDFDWTVDYSTASGTYTANFIANWDGVGAMPANVANTVGAAGEGSLAITGGVTSATIPVQSVNRWDDSATDGADQSFIVTISNVIVDTNGGESATNQTDGSNVSGEQTIFGRPATSLITN